MTLLCRLYLLGSVTVFQIPTFNSVSTNRKSVIASSVVSLKTAQKVAALLSVLKRSIRSVYTALLLRILRIIHLGLLHCDANI